MSTSRRGQVWTSAQLRARLTALHGLAPAVAQHVVYRVTIDAAAEATEGYLVPGEGPRLTAAAFDFWLAKGGLAGAARLSVAVLVIRDRLAADGTLQDCELEYRRGAADGPYCGSPSRVTFSGPAQSARFFQATPEGEVVEVAPMPSLSTPSLSTPELPIRGATPGSLSGIDAPAAMRRAVQACCGEAARILDTRTPTVIEAMVGITSVLHVLRADDQAGERPDEPGDGREVACGILWHGPIAVALRADFPRFDVAPALSAQQSAALAALLARDGLIACETRRDEHGLAVVARRPAMGDLVLVRFDGATASLAPYQPVRATEATTDQGQWLHYIETYEGLGVLDSYRDGTSAALIVLTGGADGTVWRHHVDSDGIETWRRADSGSAAGTLFRERFRYEPQAGPLTSAHAASAHADQIPGIVATAFEDGPSGAPMAAASIDPTPFDPASSDAAPFDVGRFGPNVEARFPASAYDIDEAARCLALRRPTASVFHCLRIVEQGLRAHASWRGAIDPPTPAGRRWTSIMTDLRGAWQDNDLCAALDAVRRGWRGAALQVAAKYTEEEAERIFRLVDGFMRRLAARCDEDGDPAAAKDDARS